MKSESPKEFFPCKIAAKPKYKMGEPILLTFEITNTSQQSYQVLISDTPLEKEVFNFFIVEHEGKIVRYDGRFVKRGNPTEESYIIIKPGETVSNNVDLSASYPLVHPGVYNVALNARIHDILPVPGNAKIKPRKMEEFKGFDLDKQEISFTIVEDGEPRLTSGERVRRELKALKPEERKIQKSKLFDLMTKSAKIVPHAPSFTGGTQSDQDEVAVAHSNAAYYANLSTEQLQNTEGSSNSLYQDWFGAFDQDRYDTIIEHYTKLTSGLVNDEITYDLTGTDCGAGWYAYTYYGSRTVWLCSSFWGAPHIGVDSKFGTLIHELTHAYLDTDDYVYGSSGAQNLANTDPNKAINNADNHEYFAERLALSLYDKALTFNIDRSTYGKDEIEAMLQSSIPATISDALYVIIDGFWPTKLGITALTPTQQELNNIAPSVTVSPNVPGFSIVPTAISSDDPDLTESPQRFTFTYKVEFSDVTGFPNPPQETKQVALATSKESLVGVALIYLITQPNPYEIDGPTSWLSIDLRVFQMKAAESRFGVSLGADASAFIKQGLANLNGGNAGGDSFDGISTDYEASQLELSEKINGIAVFSFAVAHVRFKGAQMDAKTVRVFFRLFPALTTSLDYNPTTTYRSWSDSILDGKKIPLLGIQNSEIVSIPCFAEQRVDTLLTNMTTQTDPSNVRDIIHKPGGVEVDSYFGCWLDINQPSQIRFPINPLPVDGPFQNNVLTIQQLIRNQHQCLVAEIAFDHAPIPAGATPGSSDKIAQRNLSIVESANPGLEASHRIPNTFEIKLATADLSSESKPDELMIDWGNTPQESSATIYLPQINSAEILEKAEDMYCKKRLEAVDEHTIKCHAGGITYIPIPRGIDITFPGLLSIDLPANVKYGQVFKVIVRQVTDASSRMTGAIAYVAKLYGKAAQTLFRWRRILGTYQITIPVKSKEAILEREERKLSVLRWILKTIPKGNRWFPVFQRYVGQVEDRVQALGGNPAQIAASPSGTWQVEGQPEQPSTEEEQLLRFKGKVEGLIYDRFGDFEGFILETVEGRQQKFMNNEIRVLRIVRYAWIERVVVTVFVLRSQPHKPVTIVLSGVPELEIYRKHFHSANC